MTEIPAAHREKNYAYCENARRQLPRYAAHRPIRLGANGQRIGQEKIARTPRRVIGIRDCGGWRTSRSHISSRVLVNLAIGKTPRRIGVTRFAVSSHAISAHALSAHTLSAHTLSAHAIGAENRHATHATIAVTSLPTSLGIETGTANISCSGLPSWQLTRIRSRFMFDSRYYATMCWLKKASGHSKPRFKMIARAIQASE